MAQNPDDAATILMFFRQFTLHTKNAFIDLDSVNLVQARFLVKSVCRLVQLLKDNYNLKIVIHQKHLCLTHAENNTIVNGKQLDHLISNLETFVSKPGLFDFKSQVNDVVKAGIDEMIKRFEFLKNISHDLKKIEPQCMQFSGEEFMVPYEVDFMGSLNTIIFPNPNEFSKSHLQYLSPNDERQRKRLLVEYRYECFFNILHEVVHCVQTHLKQIDKGSWSAEHDASRLALVLMKCISERKDMKQYFPEGKVEEIVLYVYETILPVHETCKQEFKDGYKKWISSFGIIPPVKQDAFTFASENFPITDYFKYRVGFEAYILKEGSNCFEIAKTCFENRSGDVLKIKISPPNSVEIDDREDFETIIKSSFPQDMKELLLKYVKLPWTDH